MNRVTILIFTIPFISMAVIGFCQFYDEMFKKKFILERRAPRAGDEADAQRRRYSDAVPPGSLRNPESATSAASAEVPVPQIHGV
jgi:hypothetical protein